MKVASSLMTSTMKAGRRPATARARSCAARDELRLHLAGSAAGLDDEIQPYRRSRYLGVHHDDGLGRQVANLGLRIEYCVAWAQVDAMKARQFLGELDVEGACTANPANGEDARE